MTFLLRIGTKGLIFDAFDNLTRSAVHALDRKVAGPDTPVQVCDPNGLLLETTLGALMPFAFGPHNVAAVSDD